MPNTIALYLLCARTRTVEAGTAESGVRWAMGDGQAGKVPICFAKGKREACLTGTPEQSLSITNGHWLVAVGVPVNPMPNTDALLRIAYAAAESGNFDFARECYERGAALGDFMCLQALGYMYDVGEGVIADQRLATQLYRRAWRRGSHAAATNIAILYRERGQMRTMFHWYERVARAGDGSAQLDMAKCYLSGVGVRKDVQAALRCLAVADAAEYITEYEREEAQALLATLKPHAV